MGDGSGNGQVRQRFCISSLCFSIRSTIHTAKTQTYYRGTLLFLKIQTQGPVVKTLQALFQEIKWTKDVELCMELYICLLFFSINFIPTLRLTASDIMEPNLTYVYPHTRIQSLVSILRTTVYHAFPVVTENRDNEKEFMKGNILISNNIRFKVQPSSSAG